MNKIRILIDNGHGHDTKGKCSPDKTLLEYAYTREIAQMLQEKLVGAGYDAVRIVPEKNDISLPERCKRVNDICKKHSAIFISIHVNAAARGEWKNAGGWCAFTSKGKTKADDVAECLYKAAEKNLAKYFQIMEQGKKTGVYSQNQRPIRTDKTDGDSDLEEGFYVLKHTSCPAVLTENLFQDNKSDVDFLLSPEGKRAIVQLHYDGIVNYLKSVEA